MKKFFIITLLVLLGANSATAQTGSWQVAGITNFDRVNLKLYRGAQPDEVGLESLRLLGIKTIVDLRLPGEVWLGEATHARIHGMQYTNIPMSGIDRPTDEQVAAALAVIENAPSPVFIHCRHGADRTGTIVACYRIKRDDWSSQAALLEAKNHAMYQGGVGMIRYIEDFEKIWRTKSTASSATPVIPAK